MLRFKRVGQASATLRLLENSILKRNIVLPSLKSKKNGNLSRRKRTKNVGTAEFDDKVVANLDKYTSKELEFKLKQLKAFTRDLQSQIKKADHERTKKDDKKIVTKDLEDDVDYLFSAISDKKKSQDKFLLEDRSFDTSEATDLSQLIALNQKAQVEELLPSIIRERIGNDNLVLSSLLDKSRRNYNPIISVLFDSDTQLTGISKSVLKSSILKASQLTLENIEKLDKMLMKAVNDDIKRFDTSMYYSLFNNLSDLKTQIRNNNGNKKLEEAVFTKMKNLIQRHDEALVLGMSNKMNQNILNFCIKFASITENFEDMNFFLQKFKSYGVIPNRINYTTILQFYSKLNLVKQAWGVFDTMKFLSKEHSPDTLAYNAVLLLCNKENNYSKALDLYDEMISQEIVPNIDTLNAMAKVLATSSKDRKTSEGKSESLRLLGWRYIHQIEELSGLRFSLSTIESMMALSAYDGDVGMARALYYKFITEKYRDTVRRWNKDLDKSSIWKSVLEPKLLNYLLLAYANYNKEKLPLLLGYDNGIKLRRNVINSVDYSDRTYLDDNLDQLVPLLPMSDLNEPWEILAESRAIWQFNIEAGGKSDIRELSNTSFVKSGLEDILKSSKSFEEFKFNIMHEIALLKAKSINYKNFNPINLVTFLSIPIKLGDKKEFWLRYKEFTFQEHELDNKLKSVFFSVKALETTSSNQDPCVNSSETTINVFNENNNLEELAKYLSSLTHKLVTNSTIYELIIKAASRFNDTDLATYAWQERGKFRKSTTFQDVNKIERLGHDTEFAKLMVDFFTSQNMYDDALRIVMSSQKYIDWKYPMVKALHLKLKEYEDLNSIEILLDIVNKKSQLQILDEQIKNLDL